MATLRLNTAGALCVRYRRDLEWFPIMGNGRQAGFYWALPEAGQPENPGFVLTNQDCTFLHRAGLQGYPFGRRNVGMSVRCLKSASAEPDLERVALRAETASMYELRKAPELYAERANRKEGPRAFLGRVYGKYLRKGKEALGQGHLEILDPKLLRALEKACSKSGYALNDLIPRTTIT